MEFLEISVLLSRFLPIRCKVFLSWPDFPLPPSPQSSRQRALGPDPRVLTSQPCVQPAASVSPGSVWGCFLWSRPCLPAPDSLADDIDNMLSDGHLKCSKSLQAQGFIVYRLLRVIIKGGGLMGKIPQNHPHVHGLEIATVNTSVPFPPVFPRAYL